MDNFCHHCGRELKGDEARCPECGAPTGIQTGARTYAEPPPQPKKGINLSVALIAGIAIICLIGIATIPPMLTTTQESYNVTVTISSVNIKVEDTSQYGGATEFPAYVDMKYSLGSSSGSKMIGGWTVKLDDTTYSPTSENTWTFKVSGNPKDISFTAFLKINTSGQNYDLVDIYSEQGVSGSSRYYGVTGVLFKMSEVGEDHTITVSGDSDPIGKIVFNINYVKE